MLVNDRSDIETTRCRLSRVRFRVEADAPFGNGARQPHMQADLSGRENVGFIAYLKCNDTHNSKEVG